MEFIKSLGSYDRLYKVDGLFIKVRIKPIAHVGEECVFEISSCVCEEDGKAQVVDGGYLITPAKRITCSGDPAKVFEGELALEIKRITGLHKSQEQARAFLADWAGDAPSG